MGGTDGMDMADAPETITATAVQAVASVAATAVRRLDTLAQLTAVADLDTLQFMGLDPADPHPAWASADGAAVAIARPEGPERKIYWLITDGPGAQVAALIDAVRAELGETLSGLTVPRAAAADPTLEVALQRWGMRPGDDWDLMIADAAPPRQPGESAVRTGLAAAEVQAFLDRVNPHHSVRATDPSVELWAGVRGEGGGGTSDGNSGGLLAVGALTRKSSGVGYLASIATDPAARGAGYGSAITAFLTRQVFDGGDPQCTLAHYHPNDTARRIYQRLGYRTVSQSHSAAFV